MTDFEQIIGYLPVYANGNDTDTDGIITLQVAQVPATESWLVERIVIVTSDGPGNRPFRLYSASAPSGGGAPSALYERDFTSAGGESIDDVASEGIRFWPSEVITARWTGLTAAAATWATIYLQVRQVQTIIQPAPTEDETGEEKLHKGEQPPPIGWN